MNHIKRLQAENTALLAQIQAMEDALRDLRCHLTLPKFHTDTTIQVRDVDAWCQDIVTRGDQAYHDSMDKKV